MIRPALGCWPCHLRLYLFYCILMGVREGLCGEPPPPLRHCCSGGENSCPVHLPCSLPASSQSSVFPTLSPFRSHPHLPVYQALTWEQPPPPPPPLRQCAQDTRLSKPMCESDSVPAPKPKQPGSDVSPSHPSGQNPILRQFLKIVPCPRLLQLVFNALFS